MEVFWLSIAIVALIMALYMIARSGWEEGGYYLIFPLLAGGMFVLRRKVGRKEEGRDVSKGS